MMYAKRVVHAVVRVLVFLLILTGCSDTADERGGGDVTMPAPGDPLNESEVDSLADGEIDGAVEGQDGEELSMDASGGQVSGERPSVREEGSDTEGESLSEEDATEQQEPGTEGESGFLDAEEALDEEGTELHEDRDEEDKEEFPGDDQEEELVGFSVHERVVGRDTTYSASAPGPTAIQALQETEPAFVPLEELAADPSASVDEGVTTEGEINQILATNAFTLGPDEVLVVSADAHDFEEEMLHDGMPVRLRGIMRMFDRADIENDFGLRMDQDFFRDYEGRPVLLVAANSVQGTR